MCASMSSCDGHFSMVTSVPGAESEAKRSLVRLLRTDSYGSRVTPEGTQNKPPSRRGDGTKSGS